MLLDAIIDDFAVIEKLLSITMQICSLVSNAKLKFNQLVKQKSF